MGRPPGICRSRKPYCPSDPGDPPGHPREARWSGRRCSDWRPDVGLDDRLSGTGIDAAGAGAAMVGNGRVEGQLDVQDQLTQEEPGSELRRQRLVCFPCHPIPACAAHHFSRTGPVSTYALPCAPGTDPRTESRSFSSLFGHDPRGSPHPVRSGRCGRQRKDCPARMIRRAWDFVPRRNPAPRNAGTRGRHRQPTGRQGKPGRDPAVSRHCGPCSPCCHGSLAPARQATGPRAPARSGQSPQNETRFRSPSVLWPG